MDKKTLCLAFLLVCCGVISSTAMPVPKNNRRDAILRDMLNYYVCNPISRVVKNRHEIIRDYVCNPISRVVENRHEIIHDDVPRLTSFLKISSALITNPGSTVLQALGEIPSDLFSSIIPSNVPDVSSLAKHRKGKLITKALFPSSQHHAVMHNEDPIDFVETYALKQQLDQEIAHRYQVKTVLSNHGDAADITSILKNFIRRREINAIICPRSETASFFNSEEYGLRQQLNQEIDSHQLNSVLSSAMDAADRKNIIKDYIMRKQINAEVRANAETVSVIPALNLSQLYRKHMPTIKKTISEIPGNLASWAATATPIPNEPLSESAQPIDMGQNPEVNCMLRAAGYHLMPTLNPVTILEHKLDNKIKKTLCVYLPIGVALSAAAYFTCKYIYEKKQAADRKKAQEEKEKTQSATIEIVENKAHEEEHAQELNNEK